MKCYVIVVINSNELIVNMNVKKVMQFNNINYLYLIDDCVFRHFK